MNPELLVALLSFTGTVMGSLVGILTANKLTNYRIDKIEDRLNMMDSLDRRVHDLETHNQIQDTNLNHIAKEVDRTINDIKELKSKC